MSEIIQTAAKTIRQNLITSYIYWHFMEMPESILKLWGNLIFMGLHKFSVIMHLKTLLSPFRKYKFRSESTKPILADMIFAWFAAFMMNVFSRLMGVIFRLSLIILGLGMSIIMFVIGGVIFVSWFILPVLALIAIIKGLGLI